MGHGSPVFLPGESHGQKSLVGYSPWGWEEYDTTEHTNNQNSDFEHHGTFYRSKLKQLLVSTDIFILVFHKPIEYKKIFTFHVSMYLPHVFSTVVILDVE